jgi:hypothetical protein
MINILDRIGDWNPQLMRELKGRLKLFPVLVTAGISFFLQGILFLFQLQTFPGEEYSLNSTYCKLGEVYRSQIKVLEKAGAKLQTEIYKYSSKLEYDAEKLNLVKGQFNSNQLERTKLNNLLYDSKSLCPTDQIDYSRWWNDHNGYIFLTLTVAFVVILLVAGTYQLINNMGQEEKKGTLNFIRLSPQSESSILFGKILGIPILMYILVGTAIPFHLFTGLSIRANLIEISAFYLILGASCFFFYSAALLFALITQLYRGFQPWLGAGAILFFLQIASATYNSSVPVNHAAIWLRMLLPGDALPHIFAHLFTNDISLGSLKKLQELQFFFIPVGANLFGFMAISLANFAFWSYWIWQGLQRRFRNPNTTVISKVQSYWLVASFQVLLWGFTLQSSINSNYPLYSYRKPELPGFFDLNQQILPNLMLIVFFNIVLLTGLTMILSPQRQGVQDWARYQAVGSSRRQGWWQNSKFRDLLFNDKSISVSAIALNLGIALAPVVTWVIISPALNTHHTDSLNWINSTGRFKVLLAIGMFIAITMIYVTIFQRMLLLKTPQRYFWAIGTVAALAFIPLIILGVLGIAPVGKNYYLLWLFSTFPWVGVDHTSTLQNSMALLSEIGVLILLNMRLARQVRLAGESSTQALLKNKVKV